jgi:hypothetical protein
MPGIGFILFVLPPLAGVLAGLVFSFSNKYRHLTLYVISLPLLGSVAGWYGFERPAFHLRNYAYAASPSWFIKYSMLLGLGAGYIAGMSVGVLAVLAIHRLGSFLRRPSAPTSASPPRSDRP